MRKFALGLFSVLLLLGAGSIGSKPVLAAVPALTPQQVYNYILPLLPWQESLNAVFLRDPNLRVGVGGSNPQARLHVWGQGGLDALILDWTGGIPFGMGPGTGTGDGTKFGIYDRVHLATRFLIDGAGNVGIGLTNPNKKLTVAGDGGSNTAPMEIRDAGNNAWGNLLVLRTLGVGLNGAQILFRSRDVKNWSIGGEDSGDAFQIREDTGDGEYGSGFGAVRFHVNEGGNVGIGGTVSPAYPLDVVGDANATRLCIAGDCRSAWAVGVLTGAGTDDRLAKWNNGGTTLGPTSLFIGNDHLGINSGSIPTIDLGIRDTDTGFDWVATDAFAAKTAGQEVMRFLAGGNVKVVNSLGVGIAPNYPLHVENGATGRLVSVKSTAATGYVEGIYSEVNSNSRNSMAVFGVSTANDLADGNFGVLGRVNRTRGTSGFSSAGVFGDAFGPDTNGDGKPEPFDSLAMGVQGETWSTNSQAGGGKFIAAQSSGHAIGLIAHAMSPDGIGLQVMSVGKLIEGRACNGAAPNPCSSSTVVFKVTSAGNVQADGSYTTPATDLAEYVPSLDDLEAGEVVQIDVKHPGFFARARGAYSTLVAGVVSTNPGVILGSPVEGEAEGMIMLGLAGRVPVKVTNEGGSIEVGDLLTTSSTPGYAMRCASRQKCTGTILGKALGAMDEKKGTITVLLTLQ